MPKRKPLDPRTLRAVVRFHRRLARFHMSESNIKLSESNIHLSFIHLATSEAHQHAADEFLKQARSIERKGKP